MRVAAAKFLGEVGDAGELPVAQDAVGDAQAAHVGVLRRRHVEEAVEAPAEVVDALGKLALGALGLEARVAIEGMLVALGLLLGRQLPAGSLEACHGVEMRLVGACGLGRTGAAFAAQRLEALRGAARLHAGHEAFEIAPLLLREVLRAHGQAASA